MKRLKKAEHVAAQRKMENTRYDQEVDQRTQFYDQLLDAQLHGADFAVVKALTTGHLGERTISFTSVTYGVAI